MPRKTNVNGSKKTEEAVQILTHWGSSEHTPTVYANQILITHAGPEFYIIFGELVPPLILKKEDLPSKLEIKPVARMAVSREAMRLFAEAIKSNVEKAEGKKVES